MLTMTKAEHLRGSLDGGTFSGLLLNQPFERLKYFYYHLSFTNYTHLFVCTDCEKFNMLGLKLTDSKSKCFDLNRKRQLQQSSKQCNNQTDKHVETEYETPCSFMYCFELSFKHLCG